MPLHRLRYPYPIQFGTKKHGKQFLLFVLLSDYRQARLNPLQSLAGMAQTSTGQLGQAGQAMATGVGEAGGQAAQARASGYMGGANALSQGLSQYMGYSQGQQRNALLSRAIGGGGGGGGYIGTEPYAGYNASIGLS